MIDKASKNHIIHNDSIYRRWWSFGSSGWQWNKESARSHTHTRMITGCFHFNNTHSHTHTLKQSVKILQISSSQTVVSSEHIFLLPLRDHDETTTQTQTATAVTPCRDHSAVIINTNTQWCWNDSSLCAHCSRVSHTVVLSALPRACVCVVTWSGITAALENPR